MQKVNKLSKHHELEHRSNGPLDNQTAVLHCVSRRSADVRQLNDWRLTRRSRSFDKTDVFEFQYFIYHLIRSAVTS